MQKTIKGMGNYYVLLCKSGVKGDDLICGVYGSPREAKEAAKKVDGCVAKHVIRKCKSVEISLPTTKKKKQQ